MPTNRRSWACAGILGSIFLATLATNVQACASPPAPSGASNPIDASSNPHDGATNGGFEAGFPSAPSGEDARAPVANGGATPDGGNGGFDGGTEAGDDVGPFAYAISVNPDGSWAGIEDPATEIAAIIASGAKYVRFSTPASGTPMVTQTTYLTQLIQAGVHPGAVIITQNGTPANDLIATGTALKASGLYHWLFVDGALTRTDIQQIINGLTQAGWDKIMVNDTLFGTPNQVAPPPSGVWGHAKLFDGIDPTGPAITAHDDAFIQYIHQNFPSSVALLKLEIDAEVEKFKAMPTATQIQLLTNWSQAQSSHGFKMIYPLFTTTYDSQDAGTYATMVNLMK